MKYTENILPFLHEVSGIIVTLIDSNHRLAAT